MSSKRPVVRIDLAELREILLRAEAVLKKEDYEKIASLVETLIEVTKLLRQDGATIARLRRMLGQVSSEKTKDVLGNNMGSEAAAEASSDDRVGPAGQDNGAQVEGQNRQNAGESSDPSQEAGAKPRRKGHGRTPCAAYEKAQHIVVPHESLHIGDQCPGCARGKLYGLTEPARFPRIFGQAPLAAICWDCERLRCSGCGDVYTARAPADARGPKYAESAVSIMGLLRYGTGMPLNRLEHLQGYLQTPMPASTQWEVVSERVGALKPAFDELVRLAASGDVLHNDDTYVRILEFMGKRRAKLLANGQLSDPDRTGLFTTAVVSATQAGPIALFYTGRKHAGENLATVLDERAAGLNPPIHMCDGLDRNNPKGHTVLSSNCLTHGRRHVVDEAASFPAESRYVLERLGEVFANEKICKKRKLSGEERLLFHQQNSGPVMVALETWMKAELEEKRVEPNSGLGQAFNYILKRWDKMTLFLRVPNAPLDNNAAERALKKAIQHRNDSLFYRTQRGACVGDVYMTLIYTAELHGENPFEYLTALLLNEAVVAERPSDWLPWTYKATLERPEQRLDKKVA